MVTARGVRAGTHFCVRMGRHSSQASWHVRNWDTRARCVLSFWLICTRSCLVVECERANVCFVVCLCALCSLDLGDLGQGYTADCTRMRVCIFERRWVVCLCACACGLRFAFALRVCLCGLRLRMLVVVSSLGRALVHLEQTWCRSIAITGCVNTRTVHFGQARIIAT